MTQRYLVVAGARIQFVNWCWANGISYENARVKYARTVADLQSHRPPEWKLVKTGTWYNRTDLVPYIEAYEAMERSALQAA